MPFKHGMTRTPEYRAWQNMKERCYYPKNSRYAHYRSKGIEVCDRWLHSFENFFEDMGIRPGRGYSLDRINNDGNYEPSNCHWATDVEQANNKTNRGEYGVRGVHRYRNGFATSISVSKKRVYGGHYDTVEEAISASLFIQYSY